LLKPLNQKGADIPIPAAMAPPSAGPTARLTLTPTLFAATAGFSTGFGTSWGTTACQAGEVSALAALLRNVNSRRLTGVARPSQTIAAKIVDTSMIDISPMMRNLRLSTISASAPAGTANKNRGSVLATCTSDTMKGSGLRVVINQPDAALYIQPPTLETTVAVHITANIG
jgi:hypothetical protein